MLPLQIPLSDPRFPDIARRKDRGSLLLRLEVSKNLCEFQDTLNSSPLSLISWIRGIHVSFSYIFVEKGTGSRRGSILPAILGVGSGGTLQGVGRFLKEKKPDVKIVAVEPRNCSALLGREPGRHRIQGIGDGFIPDVLDVNLVDMVFTVSDEEAIETTHRLSQEEGLLVGTSSGANVFAALHLDNGRNKVVTVLPDRAERYFSTALL